MLTIDGSHGEGGGQVLRSALALSMVTGIPFRIENIRAGRKKPGLMRQHLTAVRAAATVSSAQVEGDAIGSRTLSFTPAPGKVKGGTYTFSVGTAGSATLVLQTVLPALLGAAEASTLTLEGGTHNPFAPPFDFLTEAFLPVLERMGPRVSATLERAGFYPAGGGRFVVTVEPCQAWKPLQLTERGLITARSARALIANLPEQIAERELKVARRKLAWREEECVVEKVNGSPGPGNVLMLRVECEQVTELFTGFGEVRRPAEAVANHAVQACQRYLAAGVPVGEYLADQLRLPMAIGAGGRFVTLPLSRHAQTQIDLIGRFLDRPVRTEPEERRNVLIFIE